MSTLIVKGPIVSVTGTIESVQDMSASHDPVDIQTLKIHVPLNVAPRVLVHLSGTVEDDALPEVMLTIGIHNDIEYLQLQHQVEEMQRRLSVKIFPSAALYAFIGWLTTRKEVTHQLSSSDDCVQIADLIKRFCNMQGWAMPPDGWHKYIKEFV